VASRPGRTRRRLRSLSAAICTGYERYFPDGANDPSRPPVILVPPMMPSTNVFDVTRDQGAVGILHSLGVDPWVVDFGSPDRETGGLERMFSDHVVALNTRRAACSAIKPCLSDHQLPDTIAKHRF
jgi:poly(3-hydroxyalkanoate) synthetase